MVRLGLRWPTQYENAFVFSGNSLTSHISFPLTAEAMANDGSFHILAKPQLMLRSPGKSELFAGGEFPIKQASRFGPKVSWKSFGLQVDLEALSSSAHQVRLKISTHVSHLDEQIASDDIPGLRFNRLKTEIDAKFGLPVFLCGLLQQNKKERSKGLPLLKSIPILGKLFSSQDYLNEKSELVIVLIPHSIAPRPPEKNLGEFFAKGPAPPPRNWISPSQYSELRESSDFPWNVLR